MSLKKAVACVRKNKSFLITSHIGLEGDALGSELAFYRLLKKIGKRAVIVNEDGVPYGYSFLPGVDKTKIFKEGLQAMKFDCFAALDCSGMSRCGKVSGLSRNCKTILNIDHHISNESFADANWIEPGYSSCSEMIYRLHKEMGVRLDKDTAICLYVGMLTDTGSFRYTNTTSSTHKAVSELLGLGLDISFIYKSIYGDIPYADIKLLSKILPTLKLAASGRIAWVEMGLRFTRVKTAVDLTELILNFARSIKGVEAAVVFKEKPGQVRVNLRSQGKVDVNKIASFFSGGGHKTASGCTINASLREARNMVLGKLRESLK